MRLLQEIQPIQQRCVPIKELALLAGMCVRQTKTHIVYLEHEGLIEVMRVNKPHSYRLTERGEQKLKVFREREQLVKQLLRLSPLA